MNWAYGITTVPERVDTLLKTTLESLTKAGFDKPILFVDGLTAEYSPPLNVGGVVIFHPKVGHIPNWQLCLLHLYSTQPNADRYAIFEDDLLATKNLRQYLDHTPYPERGYWNLLTHPENLLLTNGDEGWHLSNQRGRGAVGLVFNREIARAILSSHIFLDRSACGSVAADGMVMDSVHILGYREHIHFPTLLQHVGGNQSTMGHQYGEMPAWRGEEFDLTLITAKEVVMEPTVEEKPIPGIIKVIIPTQKSAKQLEWLIEQIKSTACIPCQVYVTGLANGSASQNRNKGLEWAKDDKWVCMVDDDCQFTYPGWLKQLATTMARDEVVFASASLYSPSGLPAYMTGLQDCGGMHHPSGEWEVPTKRVLTACCVFKPNGLRFDENFIGSGFEDTDYCNQLSKLKPEGKFIVDFNSKAVHVNEMKEQRNNWNWNHLVYQSKWTDNLKPLVALYKTYRGGEWFEASLESIADNVEGIVVVASQLPWSNDIELLPENCMAPLGRFMKRHPSLPIKIVFTDQQLDQGQQYKLGLQKVEDEFGLDVGVLVIDTDEVWDTGCLRILRTVMHVDNEKSCFRSRLHNYIKQTNYRISPQEPHRPIVGLRNAKVPWVKGRFVGLPDNMYVDLPISYHHFPLVRLDESEILHKLRNTASQDGPCHQHWIDRVWNNLPLGTNIHPAIRYEACWEGVETIEPCNLPKVVRESPTYCKLLHRREHGIAITPYHDLHTEFPDWYSNLQLIELPRYHRQFEQIGMISGFVDLLKQAAPKIMVEVGCGTGETTEIACQLVDKVYGVDNWLPDPREPANLLHEDESVFDMRVDRFTNLTKIKANSLDAVKEFEDCSVDLVYIDAGHDYEDVVADIKAWLPKIKVGGYIAGHDYVWHPPVKQAVNELIGTVETFTDTSWLAQVK